MHVNELGLGKVIQGPGALLDAMGRLARMAFLVPGEGRLKELVRELVGELLSEVHGELALNKPPRTMQRPTQDISPKRRDQIKTGVAQVIRPRHLNCINGLRRQVRQSELHRYACHQEAQGQENRASLPSRQTPELTVELPGPAQVLSGLSPLRFTGRRWGISSHYQTPELIVNETR